MQPVTGDRFCINLKRSPIYNDMTDRLGLQRRSELTPEAQEQYDAFERYTDKKYDGMSVAPLSSPNSALLNPLSSRCYGRSD